MSLTSSLVAGRYRLDEEVGRGGMGVVWAAYDELLHRRVAIKQVHYPDGMSVADRERLAQRTLREAQAVAAMNDPHALRVYDVVEQDGQPWIVMEFVAGRTLTQEIRARGPLPTRELARIGLGLVDALETAHRAGVLHRDVKPSNVILGDDGKVRLTDFGIASADSDEGDVGSTGLIMGTPGYLAPERARGEKPTAAADYWSLGATLWTAAEGRPPFAEANAFATMTRVVSEDAPACTSCDSGLASLLAALLDRDPMHRPGAVEIRRRLQSLLSTPAADVATVAAPPPAALPASFDSTTVLTGAAETVGDDARRRRRWMAPTLAVAAALVVVAALLGVLPRGDDSARESPAAAPAAADSAKPSPSDRASTSAAGGGVTAGGTTAGATARHRRQAAPAGNTSTGNASTGGGTVTGGSTSSATASTPTGWQRYTDPSVGWSVAVPAGWTREQRDGATVFHDPAGGRDLLVGTRYPPGASAKGAWQEQERAFAQSHRNYQRIRLANVSWRSYPDVADWEFTYVDGGAALHALDRGAVINGRGYGLFFQTRTDRWSASQSILYGIFQSFTP